MRDFVCRRCSGGSVTGSQDEVITVEGGEIQEVPCYRYLGDLIERSGSAERAVRSRVAFSWSKWRELRGVLGNRCIPLPFRP